MREAQFLEQSYFGSSSPSDCRGGPLAHAIDSEDRRFGERRWVKRAGSVRLVMFRKQDGALRGKVRQVLADGFAQVQLFPQPRGHNGGEGPPPAACDCEVGFEHPREFQDWFVVEDHRVELPGLKPGLVQARTDSVAPEIRLVLLSGESFLLRRR